MKKKLSVITVVCLAIALHTIIAFLVMKRSAHVQEVSANMPAGTPAAPMQELHSSVPTFPAGTIPGEVLIVFNSSEAFQNFLKNAQKNGWRIHEHIAALNAVRVAFPALVSNAQIKDILSLDYNYAMRVPAKNKIEEQIAALRESFGGIVPVGKNALELLGVNENALAHSSGGEGVRIAVLDSGIFAEHEALANAKLSRIDIARGVPDSVDSLAHGTAVASLIVGQVADIAGLAPNAEILSVRVFDGEGNGNAWTLAKGIIAAVDAGAQVINISAGISNDVPVLQSAVEYANQHNVTIVAASGNDGARAVAFPAAYESVIAVGAVDGAGTSAPFSNVGANLSVVAPGVGVIAAGTDSESATRGFSGTSAAAPLIAGIVARTIADAGTPLTPKQIATTLAQNANDRGLPGIDAEYGAGLVDYERIVRPAGTPIVDMRVSDFYVEKPAGGRTSPSVLVGVQNRGNVWSTESVLSLRLIFGDGTVHVQTANIGALPANGTTGVALEIPAGTLAEGIFVEALLSDKNGNPVDRSAVKLKK